MMLTMDGVDEIYDNEDDDEDSLMLKIKMRMGITMQEVTYGDLRVE